MTASRRLAFGAIFAALLPGTSALGQSNLLDTTVHTLDLQAKRLTVGDDEKIVARKMRRSPDAITEAKCETPPVDCKIYEYRDSDDSLFVYFSHSERKPQVWTMSGFYKQGFWKPRTPAEVMKKPR